MRTGANRARLAIQPTVEQILSIGKLTRTEHLQLTSTLLSGQKITNDDRRHINRVLEALQAGRLHLMD